MAMAALAGLLERLQHDPDAQVRCRGSQLHGADRRSLPRPSAVCGRRGNPTTKWTHRGSYQALVERQPGEGITGPAARWVIRHVQGTSPRSSRRSRRRGDSRGASPPRAISFDEQGRPFHTAVSAP